MKTILASLFLLVCTLHANTLLCADSISYQMLTDSSVPHFTSVDSSQFPEDMEEGQYRVLMKFSFETNDSLTHLLIRPNDHPFTIEESGTRFFQRA